MDSWGCKWQALLCVLCFCWERKLGGSSGQGYVLICLCLLCFSWESPILSWWSVTSISFRMRIKHEWKALSSKCSRGNSCCSQPEESVLSCCCRPPDSTQTKWPLGLFKWPFHSLNLVKAEVNVLEAWPCVPLQLCGTYDTCVYLCIIPIRKPEVLVYYLASWKVSSHLGDTLWIFQRPTSAANRCISMLYLFGNYRIQ